MFERWYSRYLTVATLVAIPVALYYIAVRREHFTGLLLVFIAAIGLILEWRMKAAGGDARSSASGAENKIGGRGKQALSVLGWVAWTGLCIAVLAYAVFRQVGD